MRRRSLLRVVGLGAGAAALPSGVAAAGSPKPAGTLDRPGDSGFSEVARWALADYDEAWGELWPPARTLHDVTVVDGYAYCAFWEAGTWILDVSDPTDPTFVGRVGHYSLSELQELTEDVGRRQRASLEAPGNAHYAHAEGNLLAVGAEGWNDPYTDARGPGGIVLYDISDRTDPERLARIAPPRAEYEDPSGTWVTAHNFELHGDRLYSSWYQGGVKIHDVSDPRDPELLAWWYRPSTARFWTARVAAGDTFVATSTPRQGTEGRLYVFPDRAGRQADPPPLADVPPTRTPEGTDTPTPNPTPPAGEEPFEPLGSVPIEGAAEAVVGPDGETAYVAAEDGFVVVDVVDPTDPTVIAERRNLLADRAGGPLESVLDVAVDGDRLLVPGPAHRAELRGLLLYDVSDPADPRQVGDFHEFPSHVHNADLVDGYAYLTANLLPEQPMVVMEVPGDHEGTPTTTGSPTPTGTTPPTSSPPTTTGSGEGSPDGTTGDGGSAGAGGFGVLAALGGLGLGAYRYLREDGGS